MNSSQLPEPSCSVETGELELLRNLSLSHSNKGLPFGASVSPAEVRNRNWNILRGDFPLPLLILKESALERNLHSMSIWCGQNRMLFAPHGKTTMCPQIFARQLDAGAWAITVATVSQALTCSSFGINRILIANQVVGDANVRSLAGMLQHQPEVECYCLIDSVEGARHLAAGLEKYGARSPVGVLIEWGRNNWRTGVRSESQALEVLTEVVKHRRFLKLCGLEAYEGLVKSSDGVDGELRQVDEFFYELVTVAHRLRASWPAEEMPILSVGGSAFLDRVSRFAACAAGGFRVVFRSGCYVTNDHGYYSRKISASHTRSFTTPEFTPALELWSYVQSIPQRHLAFLTFGKRDCPYDLDLPIPLFAMAPATTFSDRRDLAGARIVNLNDQHAYMSFSNDIDLEIGSLVCCGVSHPCTAFDKWRVIPVVDDNYNVIDLYRTFF